jgi:MoaA/NifB/PqqE/SkfB family radical SAM enzyme
LSPSPQKIQLRVGQGFHIVFIDDQDKPFVVSILPPNEEGLFRTKQTTVRYLGVENDFEDSQRIWFRGVVQGVSMAERVPQWDKFLSWAASRPGVSLPNQEGRHKKMTSGMSVLVRLNEPCNAACDFCSCIGVMPDRVLSIEDARKRLEKAAAEGVTGVSFTGGEPTLYPHLLEVIALANSIGFKNIQLQTNGTRLDEPEYADAIVKAGLHGIFLSLHHHEAVIHDKILQLEGSFERAIRTIDNMLERNVLITFNHVICEDNHTDPHNFIQFVQRRYQGRVLVNFSYVSPIGRALEHLEIVPQISKVRPHLISALEFAEKNDMFVRVAGLCGIPMCQLPEHLNVMEEFYEPTPPELVTRTHFSACKQCEVRTRCSGYWKHYVDKYGDEEFQPVTLGERSIPTGPREFRLSE